MILDRGLNRKMKEYLELMEKVNKAIDLYIIDLRKFREEIAKIKERAGGSDLEDCGKLDN